MCHCRRSGSTAEPFEPSTQETNRLSKKVLGDESWIFVYDPVRRTVSRPNGTPVLHPRGKGWLVKYQQEAMLIVLGVFATFRKATVSFVMSARPSILPHATIRLPLGEFS